MLLHEAVDALLHRPDGTYIDGTFGRGGHSRLILSRLAPGGRLMAIDRDPEAVAHAREGDTRIDDTRFSIDHTRFADYPAVMAAHGVAQVDGILLDIGVSSPQIDDPARGFSFRHDGPLDMRMDPTRGQSAAEFLATAPFERIAEVIRIYGEERFAGPLARAIVARREAGQPLARTSELAALAATVVRTRERGQDPATRTFQALRIAVNRELESLQEALAQAVRVLAVGGRLVVISYHSLEDRIVKQFMREESRGCRCPPEVPVCACGHTPTLKLVNRKPLRPSETEMAQNPRSRSARLRAAERVQA